MDETSVKGKMQEAVDALLHDLASVRTGRANSAQVENIEISAYGGAQRLKIMELASITVPDPNQIVLSPWDKSVIGDIRKGIMAANVGLNPNIDGDVIRIAVPPMTSEDRERFVKLLHAKLENSRVQIRQIRGDTMRDIKKAFEGKEISEDIKFGYEKTLQEITDEFIEKIEEVGKNKEEELRRV